MLRNEASATDETNASFPSMTEFLKKIETNSRTTITEKHRNLLFKKIKR